MYAISSFIIPSKHSLLSLNPMPIPALFSWSHFFPSELTTKPDSLHLTFFSFSPLFSSIVVGVCCGRAVLFVRSRFCLPSSTSNLSSNPASSPLGSCSISISLSRLSPSLIPQDTTSTPPLIPSTQWLTSLSNGFLSVQERYIIFHLEINKTKTLFSLIVVLSCAPYLHNVKWSLFCLLPPHALLPRAWLLPSPLPWGWSNERYHKPSNQLWTTSSLHLTGCPCWKLCSWSAHLLDFVTFILH